MTRALPEWIGKKDDDPIPRRVRVRVFLLADGRCAICARRLRPGDKWQIDHRVALINGGAHHEANLQVLCEGCHKPKTVFDVAEKSKVARIRQKHLGIRKRSSFPGGRNSKWRKPMNGPAVLR